MALRIGPKSREQLSRIAKVWKQGEHVAVFGGTGSGKTLLCRQLDQIRIDRGGFVVVFVCKIRPDQTILDEYKGWTRWKTWKKRPGAHENRVLFWPAIEKLTIPEAMAVMRREFRKALDEISRSGKWTVHLDEGLLMTSPAYVGLGNEIGMMSALIRAAKGTLILAAQRPSHLPVVIYSNLSYAFIGRASETTDLKRLADLDGGVSSKELQAIIASNGKHDFTMVAVGQDWPPETLNLRN